MRDKKRKYARDDAPLRIGWRRHAVHDRITHDSARVVDVAHQRGSPRGGEGGVDSSHGSNGDMHGVRQQLLLPILHELDPRVRIGEPP